jgi:hypothetical protein
MLSELEKPAHVIGPVGGIFHDGAKFDAVAFAPDFSLILISGYSLESRTRPHITRLPIGKHIG